MISKAEEYMALAFKEAQKAYLEEEVPIGAVVTSLAGEVLALEHNRTRQRNDPTAHAEILALRIAGQGLGNFRLTGAILYVTVEPCLMCAGAIIQARLAKVVYGAEDPKAGALGSLYDISKDQRLNHRFEVIRGVGEPECRELMQRFFKARRG